MKKKLLVIVSMLCLLLVACSSSNKVSKSTKTLDDIATAMESSLGLPTTNKIEPAYQIIGAIGGVKYTGSSVEIYEYDVKSDAYKDVSEDMKIKLEGFNVDITASAVNGQYVLFADEANDKDEVINAFNEACK